MTRSAWAASVSVSVALLFAATGSVVPGGALTVAVFTSVPTAAADSVAVTVKVAEPPTGRSTVVAMSPLPLATQVAPPVAVHDQVAPLRTPGRVSATAALTTALGPALVTTTV